MKKIVSSSISNKLHVALRPAEGYRHGSTIAALATFFIISNNKNKNK